MKFVNITLIAVSLICVPALLNGCRANKEDALDAHRRARSELLAIWKGEPLAGKTVTVYGSLSGEPAYAALPSACKESVLLPQSVYLMKSSYTYLAMCDKQPLFIARMERADNAEKINIIFRTSDEYCRKYVERCSESAISTPDHIYSADEDIPYF